MQANTPVITVVSEDVSTPVPNQIELVINQQRKFLAVDGQDATVAQLLNAIMEDSGRSERVGSYDSAGNFVLGEQIFVLRDGVAQAPTSDASTIIHGGDTVVINKKHNNGADVQVSVEQLAPTTPASAELVINQQRKLVAVGPNGTSLADLLNSAFAEAGMPDRVALLSNDGKSLNEQAFILRNGVAEAPTSDADTVIRDGDTVVINKKHNNG